MEYWYSELSVVLHGSVSPSVCSLTLHGGTSVGLSVGSIKGKCVLGVSRRHDIIWQLRSGSRQDQLYPFEAELTALIAEWIGKAVFWQCFSSHWFATFSLLQLWKWLSWGLLYWTLANMLPSLPLLQYAKHSFILQLLPFRLPCLIRPLLLPSCNVLYVISFHNCFHSGYVLVFAHPKIFLIFFPMAPYMRLLQITSANILLPYIADMWRVYKEEGSSLICSKDKWIWVVKRFNIAPSQITFLTAAGGLFLAASLDHVMACVSSAHRLFSLLPGFFRVQVRGSALQLPPYHTTAQQLLATNLIPALPGKEQWVVMILQ